MTIASLLVQDEGGLDVGRILSDIPHDGPALVVYVLILGFVGSIWLGSRNSGRSGTEEDGKPHT